jgi:putative ABC transport system permease protein
MPIPVMEALLQDVRHALRAFRHNRGFVAVAVLSLMLGIGATTAIFSVVYGVLIDPYPYARSGEIWAPGIQAVTPSQERGPFSMAEYLEMKKVPAFADVMATSFASVLLTGEFAPESFNGVLMSGNAFNFLGVPPVVGRTIQPSDLSPSGEPAPVVVLSHRLWTRLFQADPGAIGKTLRLNERPYTIVGVMPPRFGWYGNDGLWMPMGTTPDAVQFLFPIVRLAPGVSPQTATEQLQALFKRLSEVTPSSFPRDGFSSSLRNYLDVTVAAGEMQASLRLLFGAVGFLLLIACANVANLQLALATARVREMALRLALGAWRGRLLRQLLTESVLLAMIGGVLGVLFAYGATKVIVALMPEFYLPNEARVTVNKWVLLFSLGISVLTGILFGLMPALRASRPDLTDALKDAGRGAGTSVSTSRVRSVLVIAEVALSVLLLVSASLSIRSFLAMQSVDAGFDASRALMVGVPLPPARYPTLEQRNTFALQLLERVAAIPGVQAVAIGNGGLPYGGARSTFAISGQTVDADRRLAVNMISADYLRALGIPLKRGRALTAAEVMRGDRVALINEAALRYITDGTDPIGKRLRLDFLAQSPDPNVKLALAPPTGGELTIVGVVGNVREDLRREPQPRALVPFTLFAPPGRTLAVRTLRGDPSLLVNPVRAIVRELDKDQPLGRPITLAELAAFQTLQPRFTMALFTFFAALGLALAAAGLYSLLSYLVTRRTHEIGVRMALGARRSDVIRLMLQTGGTLVFTGVIVGIILGLFTTRLMRSQLFGITSSDPVSYAAVGALLGLVGLIACYAPARRASTIDPLRALRHE